MAKIIKLTIDGITTDVTSSVISDSLKLSYSLFKDLTPTTNRADFRLLGKCSIIPDLLETQNDVVVEIKEGSTYLFYGYLTDNLSWQINTTGNQPISLSAEDPGIKKLKKTWVSANSLCTIYSNLAICNPLDTANSILHKICTLAGVTVDTSIPTISSTLSLIIQDKDNKTYWDVLQTISYEYGYTFYFTEDGKLNLYKIAKADLTPATSFSTSTNIIVEGDQKGISTQKKIQQYKQVNVTWDEWETKTDLYVFRDSTGGNNNWDCYIPLAPGAYYPSGADANTYVFPEYETENGQEIINVNSATADYVVDSGITVEFENLGTRGKLRIHNASAATTYIRKLKIKANSVVLVKNKNTTTAGESITPILKYEAKYIHDSATATSFANTLKSYYKYSNYTYTFKSRTSVALGTVVTLVDPQWSNLNILVLITGKEVKENGLISYTATGIDTFSLADTVRRDISLRSNNNIGEVTVPQITTPTITIGTTEVTLGGSTSSLDGISVTGTVSGNAETASKLLNAYTIGLSGKIAATGVAFDGSHSITLNVTSASITSAEVNDATNANTASKIVKRDASGNFSAGTVTVNSLVSNTDIINKTQKLYAHYIPGSSYEILTHKNVNTNDVFTIFELRSPDSAQTETTLSQHNVISGSDDWVRDISFHNYAGTTKAVDVISHFTGTNAGKWQWVSRYTDGTDYSMIERYLMALEGDTGNLLIGEDSTLTSTTRAKVDVRNYGYTSLPAMLISSDSSYGTQPSALQIQNGNSFAYTGDGLLKVKTLNASDTGTLLKLNNAGSGNYIEADSVFTLSKAGNLTTSGNLTVGGNLIINGTTTTINATTVTLDDPIVTLGGDVAPTVDDNKDRGIEFRWHNGTTAKVGFFGFDDSTGKFTFIPDATNTSEVFSGTKGTIDAYIDFSNITNKATSISGYGILDGVTLTGSQTLTNKTIAAGSNTISGLTNSNLSGSAGITNANLANSSITVGTTTISLGASSTTLAGLTSVTSTSFVGALTGNASTATKLATARTIAGVSFDGSANISIPFANLSSIPTTVSGFGLTNAVTTDTAQAITGAKTFSNSKILLLGSSTGYTTFTSANASSSNYTLTIPAITGTVITSADTGTVSNTMLAGSIANAKLAYSSVTVGTTAISLGASSTALAGLTSVTSTSFIGALTGNASTATTLQTSRNISGVAFNGSANIDIPFSGITSKPTTLSGYGITDAATSTHTHTDLSNATSSNTVSTLIKRDSSGNFAANSASLASLTTTGDATIGGNLTVTGTMTYTSVNQITTSSPIISVGDSTTDDNKDRGLVFNWNNGTTAKIGFFGYDDSTGYLTFIPDATNTSTVFSGTKGTIDAYISFSNITSKPTTLSGYGITDAAPSSHVGATGTAHGAVTTSVNGFMSAADKSKLDGIATGANNYSLPISTASILGGVKIGSGISVDANGVISVSTSYQAPLSGTGFVKSTAGVISYDTNTYITGNQIITVSGDATGSGTTSIALTLANSGVTAGTYKSVTVDAKGRVTGGTNPTTLAGYGITDASSSSHNHTLDSLSNVSITSNSTGEILKWNGTAWINNTLAEAGIQPAGSYLTANQTITVSGDATGSGTTSIALTLASTGVTAGTYKSVTVDAKGRVTAGSNFTTLAGAGITDGVSTGSTYTDPAWLTISKSKIGLANVENTAISTWAGSANITTLGTISSGTWNGSTIGVSKGGTGTSTQFTAGSILFAGTNGVYSESNAKLFWDNNTSALGIGTASPSSRLHVYSSSAPYVRIQGAGDGDNYSGFELWSADATPRKWQFVHKQTSYSFALSHFNGTDWIAPLLITTDGKVGINTSSPSTALEVNGTITATAITSTLTGNASTATALQTARTIAGVSFDGTTSISIPFANLASKPTTLSGYGITDAASSTHTHTFASLTSKPTTLSGYGITDAATSTHNHDSTYSALAHTHTDLTNATSSNTVSTLVKRDSSGNFTAGAITATSFNATSKRIYKENISHYNKSSFEILNQVDVVTFNYKNDLNKEVRIGFIADDTPSELSGKDHDKMDLANTVGLLIKAVQELKAENEELKRKFKNV
jgi:hypothetical protein